MKMQRQIPTQHMNYTNKNKAKLTHKDEYKQDWEQTKPNTNT